MNKVYGLISEYTEIREDRSRVIVAYNKIDESDNKHATWNEIYFYKTQGIPTIDTIKKAIIDEIDDKTVDTITSGLVWNGINVWLSTENQFNYKAAYDLAVQTNGSILPITFKLGEDAEGNAIYHTFESMEEFGDFSATVLSFIQTTLAAGWNKKDNFDFTPYEEWLDNRHDNITEETSKETSEETDTENKEE